MAFFFFFFGVRVEFKKKKKKDVVYEKKTILINGESILFGILFIKLRIYFLGKIWLQDEYFCEYQVKWSEMERSFFISYI